MRKSAPLIDTNIIIDVLNGDENALAYLEGLDSLFVPSVAVFEVLAGCFGKRKGQYEQAMRIFDACEIVDFSSPDAIFAADLLLKSPTKSKNRIMDFFIAGTADTNSFEVATRNVRDFKSIAAFAPYKLKE